MTNKVLIIGYMGGKTMLHMHALQEKYGNDIVLVTPDEAKEQGLKMEDFVNVPVMKLTAPPIFNYEDSNRFICKGVHRYKKVIDGNKVSWVCQCGKSV